MNNCIKKSSRQLGEEYYIYKHDSGLSVYVYPKKLTSSYALFATKYGSLDSKFRLAEDKNFTEVPDGIAHFLEHKLFETENGEDTFARYAKTGASANAYTSFLQTAYLFSCTENFYSSLEILLDFVTHPYFTPENVAKEQGIIAQEIKMYDDNPGTNMFYGLMGALYEKHKIATNIAGTVESISEIDADILYKCYNTFYNPSNMILAVCGEVGAEKTLELVDKYVAPKPQCEIIREYADEKPGAYKPRFEREFQVAKPLFEIGIKDTDISECPTARAKKSVAMEIINEILFGKSGELFNDLYLRGLISQKFGFSYEHNQSFSFNSISGESSDPDTVYKCFCEYVEKIKARGFDKSDFERIKKVVYAELIKSFDSTEDIANNLVWQVICGIELFDYVDIIAEVDYEYATKIFNSVFNPAAYAISIINPIKQKEGK